MGIYILGWPKGSFGFSVTSYGKTRTVFLANPIETYAHQLENTHHFKYT